MSLRVETRSMVIYISGVQRFDSKGADGSEIKGCSIFTASEASGKDQKGSVPGRLWGAFECFDQFKEPGNYEVFGSFTQKGVFKPTAILPQTK